MVFITAKEIFTALQRKTNITQKDFCEKLNTILNELCEMYSEKYVFKSGVFLPAEDIFSGLDVFEEYKSACIYGILSLCTDGEKEYDKYHQHSLRAYRAVWRKISRGKRIGKKRSWF